MFSKSDVPGACWLFQACSYLRSQRPAGLACASYPPACPLLVRFCQGKSRWHFVHMEEAEAEGERPGQGAQLVLRAPGSESKRFAFIV